MRAHTWMRVGCLVIGLVAAGCGDDDDDGDDDDVPTIDAGDDADAASIDAARPDAAGGEACVASFTPCGGDLVGTWSFVDGCGLQGPPPPKCEGATSSFDLDVDGTMTFTIDGSYALQGTATITISETYPAACLPAETTDCAQLENKGVDCTGDAAVSCTCTDSEADPNSEEGTYSVEGTTLTTHAGKDPATIADYCIDGDVLRMHPSDAPASQMLVLERAGDGS
jgi:hypothetical protein